MMIMTKQKTFVLFKMSVIIVVLFGISSSHAFSILLPVALKPNAYITTTSSSNQQRHGLNSNNNKHYQKSTTTTKLLMSYNLPSGGGNNKDDIADIVKGVLPLILTVAFFASPLGGFVLGIFNSVLILAVCLPLAAFFGFQVWQKVNTVSGPCPSCGVEMTVMKGKKNKNEVFLEGSTVIPEQTMCFKCGATLQANADNTGINNVSGRKTIDDLNTDPSSVFDSFFSNAPPTDEWSTPSSDSSNKKSAKKIINKGAIIDVDVLDKDDQL